MRQYQLEIHANCVLVKLALFVLIWVILQERQSICTFHQLQTTQYVHQLQTTQYVHQLQTTQQVCVLAVDHTASMYTSCRPHRKYVYQLQTTQQVCILAVDHTASMYTSCRPHRKYVYQLQTTQQYVYQLQTSQQVHQLQSTQVNYLVICTEIWLSPFHIFYCQLNKQSLMHHYFSVSL